MLLLKEVRSESGRNKCMSDVVRQFVPCTKALKREIPSLIVQSIDENFLQTFTSKGTTAFSQNLITAVSACECSSKHLVIVLYSAYLQTHKSLSLCSLYRCRADSPNGQWHADELVHE